MRPIDRPQAVILTDPAPGLKALTEDQQLKHHSITIDLEHAKNRNKNPVVQEFENKLLQHNPPGGPMSLLTPAVATAKLNACIYSCGFSSREIWTQQEQFSNHQIPMPNQRIIKQNEQRIANHTHNK